MSRIIDNKLVRITTSKVFSQLFPLFLATWAFQTGNSDIITRLVVLIPIYAILVRLGVDDLIIIQKQRGATSSKDLEDFYKEGVRYGLATLPVAVCLIYITFAPHERDIALISLVMQIASQEISARLYLKNHLCASIITRPLGIAIGSAFWLTDFRLIEFEILLGCISICWISLVFYSLNTGAVKNQSGYDWIFFIYIGLESIVWNLLPLQDIVSLRDGFDNFILQRIVSFSSTLLIIIFYGYLKSVSQYFETYKRLSMILISLLFMAFFDIEYFGFNPALPVMLIFVTLYKYKCLNDGLVTRLIYLDLLIILIFLTPNFLISPLEKFLVANFISFMMIDLISSVKQRIFN